MRGIGFPDIGRRTLLSLDAVLQESPWSFARLLIILIVIWHIYVPMHELLHVAGCVLTGGAVEELALKPQYGAHVLQLGFPFVVIDGESAYAGRLTRFTTPGRWAYVVIDVLPYLPSLFGATLLELAGRYRSALLFATGFILAYIPWISLTGDFYELASLFTSFLAPVLVPGSTAELFVSDDLFRLLDEMSARNGLTPGGLGLVVLTLALALGVVAGLTALQTGLARRCGFAMTKSPVRS